MHTIGLKICFGLCAVSESAIENFHFSKMVMIFNGRETGHKLVVYYV